MQKHVNLVDLVKSFPTNIFLQNLASIQKRTSPIKFADLAEKSERKVRYRTFQLSNVQPFSRRGEHAKCFASGFIVDAKNCSSSYAVAAARTLGFWATSKV